MPRRHSGFRNPVARSPLLRKGGPHRRSKTGQRVHHRISARMLANEWLNEQDDVQEECAIGEQQLPDLLGLLAGQAQLPPFSHPAFQLIDLTEPHRL